MLRRILVTLACALIACTSATTRPTRATYAYALMIPTDDLRPGDMRMLAWKPTESGQSDRYPQTTRLCFAVIGAFPDVGSVKSSTQSSHTCPIGGPNVVFTSDVAEVDTFAGTPVTTTLRLPKDASPGYYNLVQVSDFGGGNATSAAGIIHVVATTSGGTPLPASQTFASICGRITDFVGDGASTPGSFTLNSPGRDPIEITIPAGRLGGTAAGYACVSVLGGAPHPVFDGFEVASGSGALFVNEGVLPATAASPAPVDFVLPQGCAYVAPPVVTPAQNSWLIDCGATENRDARGTLRDALAAQGWTLCVAALAMAQWQKGSIRLGIAESSLAPGDYPRISQHMTATPSCG